MDLLQNIDIPKSFGKSLKLKKTHPKSPKTRLKAFLDSGPQSKPSKIPYSLSDYTELAEQASSGVFVPTDQEDLMALATETNSQLAAIVPVNLSTTLYGIDERDPSDFEKSKFIRQMRVIFNPEHILDLIDQGSLSPLEVETLQAWYPIYYQGLVEAVLEAISELSGTMPPPSTTRALSVLLQVPRLTPEILKVQEDEDTGGLDLSTPAEQAETEVQKVLS